MKSNFQAQIAIANALRFAQTLETSKISNDFVVISYSRDSSAYLQLSSAPGVALMTWHLRCQAKDCFQSSYDTGFFKKKQPSDRTVDSSVGSPRAPQLQSCFFLVVPIGLQKKQPFMLGTFTPFQLQLWSGGWRGLRLLEACQVAWLFSLKNPVSGWL